MKNPLIGQTLKAMYKLSGKTLLQISDESGCPVDTINNIFYSRIQKPDFLSVASIADACGYTASDVYEFINCAEGLPSDINITEAFASYIQENGQTRVIREPDRKISAILIMYGD